ncbi:hypothetical protein J0B02_08285 [Enterobacteriaceae bacterium YMB-R22]|uniref:hypothetical protein n=1 Tax=Tenebrionicola larvae TaxID=2815733 RepID=UPI0020113F29|nr:hypothetical protein [Tenebrionicola larvae]MBV4412815.1 hypothetical protein [Tenebrionicola larvae]
MTIVIVEQIIRMRRFAHCAYKNDSLWLSFQIVGKATKARLCTLYHYQTKSNTLFA